MVVLQDHVPDALMMMFVQAFLVDEDRYIVAILHFLIDMSVVDLLMIVK
jgi:hypothetical protein